VVRSVGDVDSYFLYKQVNHSTELTYNSIGQSTSWKADSRLRSPGIPRLLEFQCDDKNISTDPSP
jgi:hypothetical protein